MLDDRKDAPCDRLYAHHLAEFRTHMGNVQVERPTGGLQAVIIGLVVSRVLQRVHPLLKIGVIAAPYPRNGAVFIQKPRIDPKYPVRIAITQRPQQHAIHHGEYRRIQPDPQRQRQDHCKGESPRPTQLPDRQSKILDQVQHRSPPA